jgi:hypothetical protein
MMTFNKALKASGQLVGAEGLAMPSDTRIVRATSAARRRSRTGRTPRPRSSWPATGSWTWAVRKRRMRSRDAPPRRPGRAARR